MYRKILVPVDGSAASNRGLEEAVKLAKSLGAALRIVHVIDERIVFPADAPIVYDDQTFVASLVESGRRKLKDAESYAVGHGVKCETELVETIGAGAANIIVERARDWAADLIVMGTHGRRGVRRLVMGSDAELVVRQAAAPVLLIRAPDSDAQQAIA